jgi:hypothetical protein
VNHEFSVSHDEDASSGVLSTHRSHDGTTIKLTTRQVPGPKSRTIARRTPRMKYAGSRGTVSVRATDFRHGLPPYLWNVASKLKTSWSNPRWLLMRTLPIVLAHRSLVSCLTSPGSNDTSLREPYTRSKLCYQLASCMYSM